MRRRSTVLFPDWEPGSDGKYANSASRRRFNRHVKRLLSGREAPVDTHSFRNTFETALSTASGVPERVLSRLQGRALRGSEKEYVDKLPLSELLAAVEAVEYPGLDLSHLAS